MERQLRTILASVILYQAGMAAYYNFFSIYVYRISGGSSTTIALFAALSFAAYALTSRFWGALSDFYATRKPFMVYGLLAMGLLALLFIPALRSASAIIAVSVLVSAANAVFMPAMLAAVTHNAENSGAALGMFDGAASLGWGAGSLIMGFIAHFSEKSIGKDFSMLFVFASLSIVLAGAIIWKFFESRSVEKKSADLISLVRSSYKFSSSGRRLLLLYLTVFLGWFAIFWYIPLIKLDLFEEFAGGSWIWYGAAHAAACLTSIFASPVAGKFSDRIGGPRMLAGALIAYMLYIPAIVLTPSRVVFIILWMLPIWSFFNVGIYSSGVRLSKPENRGETMGTLESCREIAGTVAPVPGGRVADWFGKDGRNASMLIAPLFLAGALGVLGILSRAKENGNSAVGKRARLKSPESIS